MSTEDSETNKKAIPATGKTKESLIAVVRVRGGITVKKSIVETMSLLRLGKKHACIVIRDKPELMGMVKKCKDYVTWGEISEETFTALKKMAKEKALKGNEKNQGESKEESILLHLGLHPPLKGWGRKGVKESFNRGGALGKRNNMDTLIARMIK